MHAEAWTSTDEQWACDRLSLNHHDAPVVAGPDCRGVFGGYLPTKPVTGATATGFRPEEPALALSRNGSACMLILLRLWNGF